MLDISIRESFFGLKKIQKNLAGKNLENSNETCQIMMHDNLDVAEVTWDRIYNSLSIMLLLLDKKGKATNCNSAFRKYVKKPKNQILGRSLLEVLYGDKEVSKNNVLNAIEITKKRQSTEIKIKDRWIKITIDPVLSGRRKIKNMIVIIKDITERKNNLDELELREKKYKDLVELSNIAIALDDRQGDLVYFNQQFADLFEYTIEELKSLNHQKLVHPDDVAMVTDIHNKRTAGTHQSSRYEFRGITKTGKIIFLDISVTDIIQRNGQITGTRSYIRDVTERKNFINELEKALEKAKESDKLKTAFLANISHEVRTPINGIMGFAKLLERDNLTKLERDGYLKIINSCSDQLLSIVRDILDFSKIETGQTEIVRRKFDLHELIELVYNRFQPDFESKGLEYILSNSIEVNQFVETDKVKLDQIISNLLSNALKFTVEGKVELSCSIKSDYIEISIKDTGIGIEESMHENIFDRFRQVEIVTAKKYDGNGLGLSICKGFIELLNGTIWLDSKKGKGSTFYFKIPFC